MVPGSASPVPGKATPARPLLLGGSLWPDLKRGDRCTHLRGVLKGKQRGHSIVLQVLAVPEGAEALGPEVLGADDRVLLGLEVGPAHVQHPLLQQLRPAEREPVGAGRGGAKQEASERSSALLSVLGLHATPPHTPHAPGQRGTSGNLALLGHIQFPEGSVVAVPGILSRKLKTMIMFPKLCLPGELSLVPSGAAGGPALGALLGVLLWVLQSGSKIPALMEPTV